LNYIVNTIYLPIWKLVEIGLERWISWSGPGGSIPGLRESCMAARPGARRPGGPGDLVWAIKNPGFDTGAINLQRWYSAHLWFILLLRYYRLFWFILLPWYFQEYWFIPEVWFSKLH